MKDFQMLNDVEDRKFGDGYVRLSDVLKSPAVQESIAPKLQKLALEAKESGSAVGKRFIVRGKEALTGGDLLANLAIVQRTLDKTLPYSIDDMSKNPMTVGKEKEVPNFKEIEMYQTSEVDTLLEVKPGADYKGTFFTDSKRTAKIKKYGRTMKITMETMMNDVMGEFADMVNKLQRSAKRTLYKTFTDAFQADGGFYNGGNKNLHAGALTAATLEGGIKMMMEQVDANGNELSLAPEFLMVPPALTFTADRLINPTLLAQIQVATLDATAKAFPLQKIVNPFLTSDTAWYLFSNPADLEAMIFLTLSGHKGVEILVKQSDQMALMGSLGSDPGSFINDSIDYKVRIFTEAEQAYHQASVYSPG